MNSEESRHLGMMDLQEFWISNDCGLTLNSWSKRHVVDELEEGLIELDAPCPICRTNRWMQLGVIGLPIGKPEERGPR